MIQRFGYKNVVAAVYIAALFMQIMDGTIINVALPTLATEFGVPATAMDWTVLSFTLALGIMTASAGWIGDRFGLKNSFVGSLAGFTVASVICGASQTLNQLVVARAFQGGFAGMITPIGSALLFNAFPIEERAVASRKVITVAVIAPALGPIVGGAILQFFSWRWIFFVNVPIGAIALVLAVVGLRHSPPVQAGRFDLSGFLLAASGLGLLLYGISRGGRRGWDSAVIQASLISGVVLLALLVVVELRKDEPLLALRLAKDRLFSVVNILAIPVYAGFISLIYLLPLFLQKEGGNTPLVVGLTLFPQPIGVMIMSQLTGRVLYKRVGPRRLIMGGSVAALAIGLVVSGFDTETSLWVIGALMFLRGLAMGLIFIPIQAAVYARIDHQEMARATAIYGTTRQVAPAVGIAVGSTVLAAGFAGAATDAAVRVASYQQAMWVTALFFAASAVVTLWVRDEDAAATMAPARSNA